MSKKLKKFLNDAEKTESKIAELEEYLRNVRAAQKKEEDNEIVRAIRSTKLGGRDLLALLENIQAGNVTFQTTVNNENKTSEEAEMEDVIAKDPPLMEKPMNQKPSLHQMEHYQKFYENGEYVRAVESTTEQNYNMIDGCANNLPKPRIINGRESVLDKLRIRQMAREKQKSSQEQSADMERNRK